MNIIKDASIFEPYFDISSSLEGEQGFASYEYNKHVEFSEGCTYQIVFNNNQVKSKNASCVHEAIQDEDINSIQKIIICPQQISSGRLI